jgi:hypothetical protein
MKLEPKADEALRDKLLQLILSDPRTRMIEVDDLSNVELQAMIYTVTKRKAAIRKLVQSRIISAIRHRAHQLN